jgi:hypothetical protein
MGKTRETVENARKLKSVSTTETTALSGVTANVQTQLDSKLPASGTAVNSQKWNGATMYTSTAVASGGVDGDVWFQY